MDVFPYSEIHPMVGVIIQYVTFMRVSPLHTCGVDMHVKRAVHTCYCTIGSR